MRVNDSKLLNNAGKISHKRAMEKARREFDAYRQDEMRRLESDFDKAVKEVRTDNSNEA